MDEIAGGLHSIASFRKAILLDCVELKLNNKINLQIERKIIFKVLDLII